MTSLPLQLLPLCDSPELASRCHKELALDRDTCTRLGRRAVQRSGLENPEGPDPRVCMALSRKRTLPPCVELPLPDLDPNRQTRVQVINKTSLHAARALYESGRKPLVLNFANGIHPGGGFLSGARAQEEALCRSTGLYATLMGDPMYAFHQKRPEPDSTDWAILSPDVPVFCTEDGNNWPDEWNVDILTCAAPVASRIGQPRSGDLLQHRIERVLHIAAHAEYKTLVLGAWGCGAFGNDPHRTARDFRTALEGPYAGYFEEVVFAIVDWSSERRFLSPFARVFSP